jgi:hypothetical protein
MENNEKILATHYLEQVAIGLEDFGRFKELFNAEHIYSFYVKDKRVDGTKVILSVRAMRINEFADLLRANKIEYEVLDQ